MGELFIQGDAIGRQIKERNAARAWAEAPWRDMEKNQG